MLTAFILALTFSADPTPRQAELLATFRREFVAVIPGEGKYPKNFLMGRREGGTDQERPVHPITFSYRFEIAKYEVTQDLWQTVMGTNPSRWKGPRNAAEMLSFDEAQEFCRKVTRLMQAAKLMEPRELIRLPSEAEWEYTARAGTATAYCFGDSPNMLANYAWYTGNAAGNDPPVGAKKPNPWGLYDMHGYLWEWCLDVPHGSYEGAPNDGSAWTMGGESSQRVLRGGSWKDSAERLTSSFRWGASTSLRDDAIGLRCVVAQASPKGAVSATPSPQFRPTAQDEIVPRDAQLELLWNDGEFTEGPALAPDGTILFSDIGNTIYRYHPQIGETTIFRQNSGRANGLMFDQRGRLVACEGANRGGGRRISITELDGTVRMLSNNFDGKRFNSPNDLAIDSRGRVYFTDPRYVGDEPRDLEFEAVFLVDTDGKTTIATRELQKPNGILMSRDGRRVYVADNNPVGNRHLVVFDVRPDGTLANKRILYDFGSGRGIDGMTLDVFGNVYATAGRDDQAGIYVFGPEGEHLALIATPGDPTNCVFGGGSESKSLYITAQGPPIRPGVPRRYGLYRIRLANHGYHIVPLK